MRAFKSQAGRSCAQGALQSSLHKSKAVKAVTGKDPLVLSVSNGDGQVGHETWPFQSGALKVPRMRSSGLPDGDLPLGSPGWGKTHQNPEQ